MLTLFYCPGLCSLASHVTIEETGAPYQTQLVNVFKGEHVKDEYKKINPRNKVPALSIDGNVLVENVAIMYYLAKNFPNANLAPKDPAAEARWVSIMAWLSNTLHPTFTHIAVPARFTEDKAAHPAIQETAKKSYWSHLSEIDGMLSGGPWVMGPQYTTCDPYALVFYSWGGRANLPMQDLKNYTAWKDRMLKRPAVHKILEREESPLVKAA